MTKQQMAEASRLSLRQIRRRFDGIDPARWLHGRGGRGGLIADYDLEQIPQDIRQRFDQPPEAAANLPLPVPAAVSSAQGGRATGTQSTTSATLAPLFADSRLPANLTEDLAHLEDPEQQREALDRYGLIEPFLPAVNGKSWRAWRGQKLAGGRLILTEEDAMRWFAPQELARVNAARRADHLPALAGATPWTLRRWRQRFLDAGLPGLVKKDRKDKGNSRALVAAKLSEEELKGLILRCGGNAREAHRQFAERGQALSYAVVKRIAALIPKPVRALALEGPKSYEDRHGFYINRGRWYEELEPNEIWCLDHFQLDIACSTWPRREAVFPWATVVMDLASRYLVGWWPSEQPNSFSIAGALWVAVQTAQGRPRFVYNDNGKDFRSFYITGGRRRLYDPFRVELNGEVKPLVHGLGAEVIFALPGREHARSKPVERQFRTAHLQFDALFESYRGTDAKNRVEHCDALLAEHHAHPERSPLRHVNEVLRFFDYWLFHKYNYRPHRGDGMRGRAPADRWRPSDLPVRGDVNALLMKRGDRIPANGRVQFFNSSYQLETNFHDGHHAIVAYNPGFEFLPDLRHVIVYCCGQTLTGYCGSAPRTHEEISQALKLQRQQRKLTNDYVEYLARASAHLEPLEALQAAALSVPASPALDQTNVPRLQTRQRPLCLLESEKAYYEALAADEAEAEAIENADRKRRQTHGREMAQRSR